MRILAPRPVVCRHLNCGADAGSNCSEAEPGGSGSQSCRNDAAEDDQDGGDTNTGRAPDIRLGRNCNPGLFPLITGGPVKNHGCKKKNTGPKSIERRPAADNQK